MNEQHNDPDHPILPRPYLWELVEFSYHKDAADWLKSFIDMVFERDGQRRRLRFFGPQELEISKGLPNSCGLRIVDVSARQLEGIRVRVRTFEPDWGIPEFWASSVIEVPNSDQ